MIVPDAGLDCRRRRLGEDGGEQGERTATTMPRASRAGTRGWCPRLGREQHQDGRDDRDGADGDAEREGEDVSDNGAMLSSSCRQPRCATAPPVGGVDLLVAEHVEVARIRVASIAARAG